ncbi:epimerase [Leucobacter sp. L43]|uniref:epimerase n=1 Tax=Leucobacter sp. L43 TaxID=2798040 RepID=UPI0019036FEA|nr:DUF1731 domain-containing protein [Leucobacter sp. L43]
MPHAPLQRSADAPQGRVVITGAGGFMGRYLADRYRDAGRDVITVGRSGLNVSWNDAAALRDAVDGASLVVGLAGKSVNCRYTAANRAEIMRSRVVTTQRLSRAIASAADPPPVWLNASTATIYRHADDRPMTEAGGEIGSGFSVGVAQAWEAALMRDALPRTRRVALRTAIVLGSGGVLPTIRALARLGMGGSQLDGRWPVTRARRLAGTAHRFAARGGSQMFSWIHIEDAARALDFLEQHPELDGAVNLSAPNPVDNRTFMRTARSVLGLAIGPPLPRWAQEVGAIAIRTETELVLKSRWVLPERLDRSGFAFQYPELEPALRAAYRR